MVHTLDYWCWRQDDDDVGVVEIQLRVGGGKVWPIGVQTHLRPAAIDIDG